jgi:hypothetical protein
MRDFSGYTSVDLMPNKTIVLVQMNVIYGDGTDNVLTPTKAGDAGLLKFEGVVLEGRHTKRKMFGNWLVEGSTEGQNQMADHYLGTLKGILASARYVDPNDQSLEARAKLTAEWRDFDGLRFLAEIGIEKGKDGYEDKNSSCARSRATCRNGATVRRSNRSRQSATAAPQGARSRCRRLRQPPRSPRSPNPPGLSDALQPARRDLGRSRQMDESGRSAPASSQSRT